MREQIYLFIFTFQVQFFCTVTRKRAYWLSSEKFPQFQQTITLSTCHVIKKCKTWLSSQNIITLIQKSSLHFADPVKKFPWFLHLWPCRNHGHYINYMTQKGFLLKCPDAVLCSNIVWASVSDSENNETDKRDNKWLYWFHFPRTKFSGIRAE